MLPTDPANAFYRCHFVASDGQSCSAALTMASHDDEASMVSELKQLAAIYKSSNVVIERVVGELPLNSEMPWRPADIKVVYDGAPD